MNKVFRVIWSEAQGAWVAVSETTKSHSKRSRKAALALALAAGGLMGVTGYASATTTGVAGTGSIAIGPDTNQCANTEAKDERSVSIGCEAGMGAEGNQQTNLGYQAGNGSNGVSNTALGSNSGESVTGKENTAVGVGSGKSVEGSNNAAIGSDAGVGVKGDKNLSFGNSSGTSTQGDANVAVGSYAGSAVVGDDNAAFGSNAGEQVEGDRNTGFGHAAGKQVIGKSNTSLGDGAGRSQRGDGNLSAGLAAGRSTFGDHNVMLGNLASTVGSAAGAKINRTVVIGSEAKAHFDDTVALGSNATAEHENSVALGSQSQTRDAESVTEGEISYGTGTGTKTYKYSGFAGVGSVVNGVVSVGRVGAERQIINVAPGAITRTSTDAVNGSQLYLVAEGLNQRIDAIVPSGGGGGDGWNISDGSKSSEVKTGNTVTIAGNNTGTTAGNINVTNDGNGNLTIESNVNVKHEKVTVGDVSITVDGGIHAGDKKITNVAKGEISETSTDAINGSQLNETNIRVTQNENDIKNIRNSTGGMFQVSQDYNAPAPEPTGKKSAAGGAGAVASGDNSTAIGNDAKATASNSTALGNSAWASANNSVALGQGSVADRANSVSVGTVGGERQITNVAAGVAPTDAVNVSQLDALGSKVNQYFNAANKRIDKVDNNARAGIAAAMAAGTLPQSTLPGKSMVTVGASTYRGESALAIGVSRLSDNARTVIKANASADSRGNAGAAVGAGWHW